MPQVMSFTVPYTGLATTRALCPVPFFLVAAPSLFPAGIPTDVVTIAKAGAILPSYTSLETMLLESPTGRVRMAPRPVMYSSDTNLTLQSVLAGMGTAFLPGWLVDDHLKHGRLVRLLPDHTFPITVLYATYSSRRYLTSKVRTFIDFMHAALNKA